MNMVHRFAGMGVPEIEIALYNEIEKALHHAYGIAPDPAIVQRVREEWAAIKSTGEVEDVAALYELTLALKELRVPYWLRGTCGASFIFYLLGITTGNPLPPHFYCPQCHGATWVDRTQLRSVTGVPGFADGFDLPPNCVCEKDGTYLLGDGHGLPWQPHWGYGGELIYEITVPETFPEEMQAFFQDHWLTKLRSEVKLTRLYPDSDPCFLRFSHIHFNCSLDAEEISPGFYDIVPDASCQSNAAVVLATHLKKVDDLSVSLDCSTICSFADAVTKFGLAHSSGTWDRDTEFMIDRMGYFLQDMIAFREDVFFWLLSHGFSETDAWKGMESVRKGRGLSVVTDEMLLSRDKWVMDRCSKIKYLSSKAHALEFILFRLRAEGMRSRFITSFEALIAALQLNCGPKLILMGARPGMGKTSFARFFTEHLSTVIGKKAITFSQECMTKKITINLIREHIKSKHPDLIVVDELRQIEYFNRKTGSGGKEMGMFMADLRALADEENVSILVLSGLKRRTERQRYHWPKMSNFFHADRITPCADAVLFLHRPGYYDCDVDQRQALCVIEKAPSGETGVIPLIWNEPNHEFCDAVYSSDIPN